MAKLNLDIANLIIEKAIAYRRANGGKPIAVVVLDDSGNLKACQREDGASMFRPDVAMGKAWASVAFDVPSRALAARTKDTPVFMSALASTANGKFLAQTGGVLIKDEDQNILGAAGISGDTGDNDERFAIAGVEGAGLVADPASS